MSITDDLMQLKELLGAGVLTPLEFERAKLALLSSLPNTADSMPSKSYFFGEWRMVHVEATSNLRLYANGCCKLTTSKASLQALNISPMLVKFTSLDTSNGQWWVDDRSLQLKVTAGNVLFRALPGGGTEIGFAINIISCNEDQFLGHVDSDECELLRLNRNP
jgi:hypothetical protein